MIARASRSTYLEFIWNHIGMYITPLFGKPTPLSPNSVVVSTFHHIPRHGKLVDKDAVTRRLAATSAALYTQEIGWSVVDALSQVASMHSLRPHIPIGMWVRLVKWPSLPPKCSGRSVGTGEDVRHVRALGDFGVLKLYLLLFSVLVRVSLHLPLGSCRNAYSD